MEEDKKKKYYTIKTVYLKIFQKTKKHLLLFFILFNSLMCHCLCSYLDFYFFIEVRNIVIVNLFDLLGSNCCMHRVIVIK